MAILGAHMSIAGGYYKAVESAGALQMNTVQVFSKNNNQWRAKPITPEETRQFRDSLERYEISHPLAHSSYLINLASPDEGLWQKSVESFTEELRRASALGLFGVVLHPGAATCQNEAEALARIIRGLDVAIRDTSPLDVRCLLETTAGQGSCLGWRFEHLAAILQHVQVPERFGVCFDTCHVFAAGYPLAPLARFRETMSEFDRIVGLDRILAFHLNDSKRDCGSRVDRHEHIGLGKLGLEPFRYLLNDRRFRSVPMYLETPKGEVDGTTWDAKNLSTLRDLVKTTGKKSKPPAR